MPYLWNGKRDIAVRLEDVSMVKIAQNSTDMDWHILLTVNGTEVDFAQFDTEMKAYRVVEEKLNG